MFVGLVDLTADDFAGSGIEYWGFTLWDTPLCNILPYLGAAADIINSVVSSGGRVMVSCQMGVSRSAACVMAYLMIHTEMTAKEALTLMRRSRDVRPNDGFLQQLLGLDTDLRIEREGLGDRMIELATKEDLPSLPRPWNFEFFVKEVSEEEVGSPLVNLGQPCPLRLSGDRTHLVMYQCHRKLFQDSPLSLTLHPVVHLDEAEAPEVEGQRLRDSSTRDIIRTQDLEAVTSSRRLMTILRLIMMFSPPVMSWMRMRVTCLHLRGSRRLSLSPRRHGDIPSMMKRQRIGGRVVEV